MWIWILCQKTWASRNLQKIIHTYNFRDILNITWRFCALSRGLLTYFRPTSKAFRAFLKYWGWVAKFLFQVESSCKNFPERRAWNQIQFINFCEASKTLQHRNIIETIHWNFLDLNEIWTLQKPDKTRFLSGSIFNPLGTIYRYLIRLILNTSRIHSIKVRTDLYFFCSGVGLSFNNTNGT